MSTTEKVNNMLLITLIAAIFFLVYALLLKYKKDPQLLLPFQLPEYTIEATQIAGNALLILSLLLAMEALIIHLQLLPERLSLLLVLITLFLDHQAVRYAVKRPRK